MKNFYSRALNFAIVLVFMLLSSSLQKVHATHAMGVDITYTCLGGNLYQFNLTFYRDCAGVNAPGSTTLSYSSASCTSSGNIPLTLQGPGIEVSPLCPAALLNSTCNSGSQPGVEQYIYSGTVVLPAVCPDWIISWNLCCRNNMITNLVGPGGQSMFIFAELNNTSSYCNNSPQFTSLPVPYICTGQPFCYNHGAFDPDGDSLVYSLVNALDGPGPPGNAITYNAPYSPTYPIGDVSASIIFDSTSGSMCVTPDAGQVSVVTVRVEEYRNGVKIGSVMRDIQVVVTNCINQQPQDSSGGLINMVGGVLLDSNSIEICPGPLLSFDVVFADPNLADTITLTSNVGTVIPGATFTVSGFNPVTGSFSWTPTGADIGFYSFIVTIQDDGCPILGSQVFSYDIDVLDGTTAGPDLTFCLAAGSSTITASGGTQFQWTDIGGGPPVGLSCDTCAVVLASPPVTTTYVVTSNLSATCKNSDTVTVNIVPDFVLDAGVDTSICKYSAAFLSGTAGPALQSPYSYSWTPAASLTGNLTSTPIATPLVTTPYVMEVTSDSGCVLLDTMNVIISSIAPIVSILAPDTVCVGDTVQLFSLLTEECQTTTDTCTATAATSSIGTAFSSAATFGPHFMQNFSQRIQYIYHASELTAMGFVGGRINSIALDYASVNSTVNGVEVYMGCTNRTNWTTSTGLFETGLSLVKSSFSHAPAFGWNTLTLDFPYRWDGSSNLVVEFCVNTNQAGTPSNVRYTNITGGTPNRTLYENVSGASGACASPTGTSTASRPNMQFNYCEAVPGGITYTWTPGGDFVDNTIDNPFLVPPGTGTYTLQVFDGLCNGTGFVNVIAAPTFALDAGPDTTICRNSAILMPASVPPGSYTFTWSPPTALSATNILNPITSPSTTTAYELTAKSLGGCELTDSILVTVFGVAPQVDAGPGDTICPGADTAQLAPIVTFGCDTTSVACSGAANNSIIGTQNNSSNIYGPWNHNPFAFVGFKRQYIFTKAELDAMGFTGGGRIDSLGLNILTVGVAGGTGPQLTNLRISVGCITDTIFTSPGDNFKTGLTLVGSYATAMPVLGWNVFAFDNAYNWDGQSNLVVEFCTTSGTHFGQPSNVQCTDLGASMKRTLWSTSAGGNPCTVVGGTSHQWRPNVRFSYCAAIPASMTFTWTPSTGLSNAAIINPTAAPNFSTTYMLSVDDGSGCDGTDFVTVANDSSAYVVAIASKDTIEFCSNDTIDLGALITGTALSSPLSCGANSTPCVLASSTQDLGTGTSSSTTLTPFTGAVADGRVQYLIHASEMTALGFGSGSVTVLGWYVSNKNSSGVGFTDFSIKMGCTSDATLSTPTWVPTSATVWGPSFLVTNAGWNLLAISPFDWDGTSNLVVEVCYNNADGVSIGTDDVEFDPTLLSFNGTMRNSSITAGANGCTLAPAFMDNTRPNMQITVCPPPPNPWVYSWTPAASLVGPNTATPKATPGVPTTYTVTVTGHTCTLVDTVHIDTMCVTILPIDGLTFDGHPHSQGVRLVWETEREYNNDHFVVERSTDGIAFTKNIGKVMSQGPSEKNLNYSLLDQDPIVGINYYRLRIVDDNGRFEYSDVVAVLYEAESAILIYPNPAKLGQSFFLEYHALEAGKIKVDMVDVLGRFIGTRSFEINVGENLFEIPTSDFADGTYFLRIASGKKVEVRKLQVTK